jgi:ubiquitin C-terminal hydrolase
MSNLLGPTEAEFQITNTPIPGNFRLRAGCAPDLAGDNTKVSARTTDRVKQLSIDARLGNPYPKRHGGALAMFMGSVMAGLGIAVMATGVAIPVGAVLTFIGACFLANGGCHVASTLPSTSSPSRRRLRKEAAGQPMQQQTARQKDAASLEQAAATTLLESKKLAHQHEASLDEQAAGPFAHDASDLNTQLTGLNNCGVDCYANATLQFLRELEPEFIDLFGDKIHANPNLKPNSTVCADDLAAKKRFRQQAGKHLLSFFKGNVRNWSDSKTLRQQVQRGLNNDWLFPQLVGGISRRQCDAEEFLKQLLDAAGWPHVKGTSTSKLNKMDQKKIKLRQKPGNEFYQTIPLEIANATTVQEAFNDFSRWESLSFDNCIDWADDASGEPSADDSDLQSEYGDVADIPNEGRRMSLNDLSDGGKQLPKNSVLNNAARHGSLNEPSPRSRSASLSSDSDSRKSSASDIDLQWEHGRVAEQMGDDQRMNQDDPPQVRKHSSNDSDPVKGKDRPRRGSLVTPSLDGKQPKRKVGAHRRKSIGDKVDAIKDAREKAFSQKQLGLSTRPDVMFFSLKRFEFDNASQRATKICRDVEIGPLTIPASNGQPKTTYLPHAVICHDGDSPQSGHYVTYRKINGAWWKFNDTKVDKADDRDAAFMKRNGYVMLYRRADATGQEAAPPAELELG